MFKVIMHSCLRNIVLFDRLISWDELSLVLGIFGIHFFKVQFGSIFMGANDMP